MECVRKLLCQLIVWALGRYLDDKLREVELELNDVNRLRFQKMAAQLQSRQSTLDDADIVPIVQR